MDVDSLELARSARRRRGAALGLDQGALQAGSAACRRCCATGWASSAAVGMQRQACALRRARPSRAWRSHCSSERADDALAARAQRRWASCWMSTSRPWAAMQLYRASDDADGASLEAHQEVALVRPGDGAVRSAPDVVGLAVRPDEHFLRPGPSSKGQPLGAGAETLDPARSACDSSGGLLSAWDWCSTPAASCADEAGVQHAQRRGGRSHAGGDAGGSCSAPKLCALVW